MITDKSSGFVSNIGPVILFCTGTMKINEYDLHFYNEVKKVGNNATGLSKLSKGTILFCKHCSNCYRNNNSEN